MQAFSWHPCAHILCPRFCPPLFASCKHFIQQFVNIVLKQSINLCGTAVYLAACGRVPLARRVEDKSRLVSKILPTIVCSLSFFAQNVFTFLRIPVVTNLHDFVTAPAELGTLCSAASCSCIDVYVSCDVQQQGLNKNSEIGK